MLYFHLIAFNHISFEWIIPFRTFWVTTNVLPVSSGTVQFTGSGDRMIICSGDFTRVGSGGDLTMCSMSSCIGSGLALETEPASRSVSSSAVGGGYFAGFGARVGEKWVVLWDCEWFDIHYICMRINVAWLTGFSRCWQSLDFLRTPCRSSSFL